MFKDDNNAVDQSQHIENFFDKHFVVTSSFNFSLQSEGRCNYVRTEPLDLFEWVERIAKVKENTEQFYTLWTHTNLLNRANAQFAAAQYPDTENEIWVGMEGQQPKHGTQSVVVYAPLSVPGSLPQLNGILSGLLLDEWNEIIPNKEETTAVAYHYDAPSTNAPQAILLAVPSQPNQTWTLADLEAVILETIDLVKLRAVDPDILASSPIFNFLPALYFAQNNTDLSVDFG
jgi:hypothetical protein